MDGIVGATGEHITSDIIASRVPPEAALLSRQSSISASYRQCTADNIASKEATANIEAFGDQKALPRRAYDYPEPTLEETNSLRKVADSIPSVAWLLCIVEFAERASYYGAKTVFSNFVQFPLPEGGNGAGSPPRGTQKTAGALGRGLQFSNAFTLLFAFLSYVIPIGGAYIADVKLGRYKTILIGVLIAGVAHIIQICGAIPSVLQAGNGLAPFLISLFLLAIGAGIFKPNVSPVILDQYPHQKAFVKELSSGERVIVDPEVTVNRIMLIFYGFVNIGAFFTIVTTYSEKYVGFWLAYLLPGIIYFLLPALLWYFNGRLYKQPPDGSALNKSWKIITVAFKYSKGKFWSKSFWSNAMPSELQKRGITTFAKNDIAKQWTDRDVDDIKCTATACAIFLYFPIFNLNDGGIGSVSTSQGSTMTTNGAPNDLLGSFNPLTIIVFVPFLSYIFYPLLRRYNIKFGRISRITTGFVLAALSSVISAIIQWRVYETSPCGYHATGCDIGTGVSPINIWWQVPNHSLGAMAECFCNVTAYELAYARSPPGMRAVVVALFLFATALSSALGELISPAIKDPYLIWIWAGPAIALAVQTVIFWFRYKKFNEDEFMTSDDPVGRGDRSESEEGSVDIEEVQAKTKA